MSIVTAEAALDVPMHTMIVNNPLGAVKRLSITVSADATLGQLHQAVASQAGLVPGTFELRKRNAPDVPFRLTDDDCDTKRLYEADMADKSRLDLSGVDGGGKLLTRGEVTIRRML